MKPCRVVLPLSIAVGLAGMALMFGVRQAASPQRTVVRLANRTVVADGFPEVTALTNQTPSVRGTLPYVVIAEGRAGRTLRLAIEAAGVRVVGPYPPNAFLVEAKPEDLRKLSGIHRIVSAVEFLPADKVDARLSMAIRGGADSVEATVVALDPTDLDGLRGVVAANGGEELQGCLNGTSSFKARIPVAAIGQLARRGDVRWIEAFSRPKLLNDLAVEPEAMNVRETWDAHGLSGAGQIVSTSDTGIDTGDVTTMHRDLADRVCGIGVVTGCHSSDRNGHGTHTAGSIVGNGTMSEGAVRGTAWGARLWAWFCNGTDGGVYIPSDCGRLFRPDSRKYPTYIHSASWGDDVAGLYDSQCETVDAYVWAHPDFLPVFAAGNKGSGTRTVGSPAAAKNVLAVGATQNLRTSPSMGWADGNPSVTASYSSRGPCQDGRIKPDIAAPGTGILSTRAYACSYSYGIAANTNYAYSCGTSMATPLVAGAVALVREWLVDRCGFTNQTPSAALMKAVVTGGAKGASVPNNSRGWGRVDLAETLFPSNRAVKLFDRIPFAQGARFSYELETTNAAPLDVQLVWLDYPVAAGSDQAAPQLVNDLDLSVELIDSETDVWLGNGGSSPDRLNTLESVRIADALPARYRVTVDCSGIVYDSLEGGAAALYIRGAFDPAAVEEPRKVKLTVSASLPDGAVAETVPREGVVEVTEGSTVLLSADEFAYGTNVRGEIASAYPFLGFAGGGSVPSDGTSREIEVRLERDSTIEWRYAESPDAYVLRFWSYFAGFDNYFFRDESGSYSQGGLLDEEHWVAANEEVEVSVPDELPRGDDFVQEAYTYSRWWGYRLAGSFNARLGGLELDDADGSGRMCYDDRKRLVKVLSFEMDGPKDVIACYYSSTAMVDEGLPAWWYARYLYGSYDAGLIDKAASLSAGDPDGDGFLNAAEYVDETDPVDGESFRFRIDEFSPQGMTFTGSTNGNLVVERCDSPGGEWSGILTNRPPRASVTNVVRFSGNISTNGFYRVIYCR